MPKGLLWIAEVRSRYAQVKGGDTRKSAFVQSLCSNLNFKLLQHDNSNKMFVTYVFEKQHKVESGKGSLTASLGKRSNTRGLSAEEFVARWPKLSSCMYKKR